MISLTGFLLAISLLTVFRAPAKPLWYVAIAVTEWGHLFALASLVLVGVNGRMFRRWTPAMGMALTAAILFMTPYLRATQVAKDLPKDLERALGPTVLRTSSAPSRQQPLSFTAMFRSLPPSPVQFMTLEYAQVQGQSLKLDLYRPVEQGAALPGVIVFMRS